MSECSRCGTPIDDDLELCRLCTRELRRGRVVVSQLSFKPKPEEKESRMGQVFPEDQARGLHAGIDRSLSVLSSIDVVELGRKLHELVALDVSNPTAPDGFPTSTPGASVEGRPSSGPVACVDPKTGDMRHDFGETCEHCEPTAGWPVERAVEVRQSRALDEVHMKLELALGYLGDAANALKGALNKAAEVERVRATAGLQPGAPGCWALERIGAWEPVLHRVLVEGQERPLGSWAYKFYRRNGRVPNRNECREHVDNPSGRVRVEASTR